LAGPAACGGHLYVHWNHCVPASDDSRSRPQNFRIKISNSTGVVYDNRAGSSEDPDISDLTALGGSSIVTHK
jgi:hypothetical protein